MKANETTDHQLSLGTKYVELQSGLIVSHTSCLQEHSCQGTFVSDSDLVHFNCLLQGKFEANVRDDEIKLDRGSVSIGYGRGETFDSQFTGDLSTIEVMIHADLLIELAGEDHSILKKNNLKQFFACQSRADSRVTAEAIQLARYLNHSPCQYLLVYSSTLSFLSWHLNAFEESHRREFLSQRETRQLYQAKDFLLQDLTSAPTISEISRYVGLNQFKLKKGFKALFDSSIYAYFQAHRMEHARELLKEYNVTETAMMVGYSNFSHFSCAFYKHFGILPRNARRKIFSCTS